MPLLCPCSVGLHERSSPSLRRFHRPKHFRPTFESVGLQRDEPGSFLPGQRQDEGGDLPKGRLLLHLLLSVSTRPLCTGSGRRLLLAPLAGRPLDKHGLGCLLGRM